MMSDFGNSTTKILEFHQNNGHQIIQAFELPTEIGRYDTTSVNVHNEKKGEPKGLLSFGHSKDNHPNLLQFKQGLGVLYPAGIPIFSETISGNSADDPLYVPAWRQMVKTYVPTNFLFVSDCKGSALETRASIALENGFYLVPLARTGKVPFDIENLVKNSEATPEDIILSDVKDKHGNPTKVGKGFVVEKEMESDTHIWTERWFVARSNSHASLKNKSRTELKKAETALNKLTPKSEVCVSSFSQRASKVLKKYSAENMIDIKVDEIVSQQKRFLKRGRPTKDTPFEIIETHQLQLNFTLNQEQIE
jgi:transposase